MAQKLTDSAGLASLGVICKEPTTDVYPEVLSSLNEIGKDVVQEVNPWVINTLVDWCNFDKVICSAPLKSLETHSSESTSSTDCSETSSSGCSSSKAIDKWSPESTRYLLGLYKENMSKFESPFSKKKSVWKQVSESMEKEGFLFDPTKCERKVLNLKANFKKVKVYNAKSGNEPKSCPFFEELNEIFQKDPSITPLSTCSNLINQSEENKPRKEVSVCNQSVKCSDPKKKQPAITNTDTQPKKKQKKSDIIISLLEKQQERDQERTALLKEMRDQQREQTNRFLNIFEKALCGKPDANNNSKDDGSK